MLPDHDRRGWTVFTEIRSVAEVVGNVRNENANVYLSFWQSCSYMRRSNNKQGWDDFSKLKVAF